jgi:hypothetical protein
MENEEVSKTEQILEKREKKITNWLKNKYNFAFLALIVFAILFRIYYFLLTKNQPIWWDEAEYMNLARRFAFGSYYMVDPARQVLFSFITSIFFRISNTELLPRLFLVVLSVASIFGVYYLGKEMYDKKVGLIAGLFMSVFYMNMFFTYRLINDVPSLAFFTFSAYFFYKYFKTNSKKMLYLASIMIGIGTLFKLTTASLLFVVLIYLLVTEKLRFLKKKEIWIAALIFIVILLPYIIWGYFEYHGFVILKAQETIVNLTPNQNILATWPGVMGSYINTLPWYLFSSTTPLYWFISLVIVFGLIILTMYKFVIGFDILLKQDKEKTIELSRSFYLILLLLVHFILVSLLITHNEDRYILNSFPALFIIFGIFIMKGYDYFDKKKLKTIGIILVIVLIGIFCYLQIKQSDSTIKNKISSYGEVRDTANWLKDNTNSTDVIISSSAYQVRYYSMRDTYLFPPTEEEFKKMILEKHPKYFMVSVFEGQPDYADEKTPANAIKSFQRINNLTLVRAYFTDASQTQWFIKVYQFPNNFIPKITTPQVSQNINPINSSKK